MNIKQQCEFDTGLNTLNALKADKEQKELIKINKNTKKLFVVGNYCSGTSWLNYLIIKNTPINYLYALRNQHEYLDDNNNVIRDFKHRIVPKTLLNQKKILILYIIRDFDNFLKSFLQNSYDKKIENGIVLGTNMNVYEWYCHMIESNISLLRNSDANYMIVNMEQMQKTNGEALLKYLEIKGFKFVKPYTFIDKHTKTGQIAQNREWSNITDKKLKLKRNNTTVETILKNLAKQPEIRISWK
jgi:hypothetical protein